MAGVDLGGGVLGAHVVAGRGWWRGVLWHFGVGGGLMRSGLAGESPNTHGNLSPINLLIGFKIGNALSTISLSTNKAPPLKEFLFIHTLIVSVFTCCNLHLSLFIFVVT